MGTDVASIGTQTPPNVGLIAPVAPEAAAALAATDEQASHPAPPTEGLPVTHPPVNPAAIPPAPILGPTGPEPETADGAEDPEDGQAPAPEMTLPEQYARFYQLMTKLFGGNIFSERLILWVQDQIRTNGKLDFHDDSFREMLAEELKIPESMISDAGLDYFFGDQSGELNEADAMSLSRVIDRLEFLVPIYQGQAAVGGSNATQTLRADTIMLMSFESDCLDGIDFAALRESGDPLFEICMQAAAQAYLNSADATEAGKKAVQAYYYGQTDKLPEELMDLLFSNYWSAFKAELGNRAAANGTQALPIELLNEDTELRQQFLNGIFLDFVEGSLVAGAAEGEEEPPTVLVHEIPEEIDEESIAAAYNERINNLPPQAPVPHEPAASVSAETEPAAEAVPPATVAEVV